MNLFHLSGKKTDASENSCRVNNKVLIIDDMKSSKGFTLLELMVTLAVSAILMFVAVPSFVSFIRNSQMTTQANAFFTDLSLTKSEAVKRNARVSICASADSITCSGSTNWATGWIVFTDASGASGVLDGADELLRVHDEIKGEATLISNGDAYVQFTPSGYASTYTDAAATEIFFTLDHSNCTGDQKRVISVAPFGRVEVERQACGT